MRTHTLHLNHRAVRLGAIALLAWATLAAGPGALPTLDVGDVDQDGDLDIVAGRFLLTGRSEEWLEVWENVSPPKRAVP